MEEGSYICFEESLVLLNHPLHFHK